MKKNCLYEREFGWVQYDEETYVKLRRERLRMRMRMRRQDRCVCPGDERWRCDGMCDGCPFKRDLEVSLSIKVGGSEDVTFGETLSDGIDYENAYVEKMYCEDVLKRLDEIMPMARQIGVLRLQGKSDREIAKALGVSRTSMYRMLEKAQKILLSEFEEI